jgi:hypothetical protein
MFPCNLHFLNHCRYVMLIGVNGDTLWLYIGKLSVRLKNIKGGGSVAQGKMFDETKQSLKNSRDGLLKCLHAYLQHAHTPRIQTCLHGYMLVFMHIKMHTCLHTNDSWGGALQDQSRCEGPITGSTHTYINLIFIGRHVNSKFK